MNDKRSLVSVLMNCYNSEKYLEETLQSLFSQTYPNWQLVFVDNCSTDNSKKILDKYGKDSRILYMQTPHHMPLGEARELGLSRCSGDFICFLDTDDLWRPEKLEKQLQFFSEHDEVMLCYSSYFFINEKSKITGNRNLKYRYGDLFGQNLAQYEINFQTVMIRNKALNEIERPYFDPILIFSPDYNLIMRVLAFSPAVCLNDKLVYYRKSAGSLTRKSVDRWGIEVEYTYQQLENLGILNSKSNIKQQQLALATIAYYKAINLMNHNNHLAAADVLKNYRYTNYKFYVVYRAASIPTLWKLLHALKEKIQ